MPREADEVPPRLGRLSVLTEEGRADPDLVPDLAEALGSWDATPSP